MEVSVRTTNRISPDNAKFTKANYELATQLNNITSSGMPTLLQYEVLANENH